MNTKNHPVTDGELLNDTLASQGTVSHLDNVIGQRLDHTKTPPTPKRLDVCKARVLHLAEMRRLNEELAPSQRWQVQLNFSEAVSYLAAADPRMSADNPAVDAVDREIERYVKTFLNEAGVPWRLALDEAFGEEASS